MTVGDSDINPLLRIVFAKCMQYFQPPSTVDECEAVVVDLTATIRSFQIISETAKDVQQFSRYICYTLGDVGARLCMQLLSLYEQYGNKVLVGVFDCHTPVAKRIVQHKRRECGEFRKTQNDRAPYHWPNSDNLHLESWFTDDLSFEMTWSEIFYHPVARKRFNEYIVRYVITNMSLPVGCSLILDGVVLGGQLQSQPIILNCFSSASVAVDYYRVMPARWTYAEADLRVGLWAAHFSKADRIVCRSDGTTECVSALPVIVIEEDMDVLHVLLHVEKCLVEALGADHNKIWMVRVKQIWNSNEDRTTAGRYVKITEYVNVSNMYIDIYWLFGAALFSFNRLVAATVPAVSSSSVLTTATPPPPQQYNINPIDMFTALLLLRGDDYCMQLEWCTFKTIWRCFFESYGTMIPFLETVLLPLRPVSCSSSSSSLARVDDGLATLEALQITQHKIHFAHLRCFVDACYAMAVDERSTCRRISTESDDALDSISPRKRSRSTSAVNEKKSPRGWPDDECLAVLAARLVWQINNLANGWHLKYEIEKEYQTTAAAAAVAAVQDCSPLPLEALSVYGWLLDSSSPCGITAATRVYPRQVFKVENGVDPVVIVDREVM